MPDIEVTRDHAIETLVALAIFIGGLAVARVLLSLLRRIVHLFTHSRERQLDERLSRALRMPSALLIAAAAAFIAIRTLSYLDPYRETVERVWEATLLALAILLVQRLTSALFFWAADAGPAKIAAPLGGVTPLARRAVNVAIVAIGALLVLDQLGISISPLLAGLGISGLAVALALQPLLTNLFAGSYVMSDSSIREGDFITILNGPSGYVMDIGWRATRLRNPDRDVVIVPNATLASSIVTNYGPGRPVDVSVVYAIPYGRSLDQVERVAGEVLRSVVQEREEAVKDFKPLVRFQRFGDARIECLLQVRARSRAEAPVLTHMVMKRVHDRFQAEGFNPE